MTNLSLGLILLIFTCIGFPVLLFSIIRKDESDASVFYMLMCASNALWAVFNALFYLLPDERTALLFYELRFVFVCYSSIFTYLFALKSLRHVSLKNSSLFVINIFPLATMALVLTNKYHGLMRTGLSVVLVNGVRTIRNSNGIWFWVHCSICYACLMMAAVLMIRQFLRLPRNYRLPVTVMFSGICMTMLTTLLSVLDFLPYSFDVAPIVVQISQIIFFYALYNTHSLDMLFTSRDTIFEKAGYAIFILNNDGGIMDYNLKAAKIGKETGIINLYGTVFATLLENWMNAYSGRAFEEDPSIFTVHRDNADAHYQLSSTAISNNRGKEIGSYVEITNITPIMSFVHRLQDFAYYDQLTGLYNRHSFTLKLPEFGEASSLPLGVVVGDVNRLKQVNDTFGHAVGDELLKTITGLLVDSSPSRASWFRTGGDEFIGLVPNTSADEMESLLHKVWAGCEELKDPRFLSSEIALAYRIKSSEEQDISALMNEADRLMYENKYNRRK